MSVVLLSMALAATHEIDPGFLGCSRFFRRLDVDVREDTLPLELLQVVDSVFLARPEHSVRSGVMRTDFRGEQLVGRAWRQFNIKKPSPAG